MFETEVDHTEGRFFAKTAHGEAELLYRKASRLVISAYHTYTPPEDRGQGIAAKLATAVFEYAKKNKLRVRPDCPYVQRFLGKHREWQRCATP